LIDGTERYAGVRVERTGVTQEIFKLALAYDVTLDWWRHADEGERAIYCGPRFEDAMDWGPAGSMAINYRKRRVWVLNSPDGPEFEYVFHELVHVIAGAPTDTLCEGFLMLPLEWALAQWIAKNMRTRERKKFLEDVNVYQGATEVARSFVRDDRGHRLTTRRELLDEEDRELSWWKNGLRRAQMLGLLDENLAPTYKKADWRKIYAPRAAGWSVSTDEQWMKAQRAPRVLCPKH
jgi:hypothetical protein